MTIAEQVATKSLCLREESRFGIIAVKKDRVVASGYNGALNKIRPCAERGSCIRRDRKIPSGTQRDIAYCICAEQRMICDAAREGISLKGADVYTNSTPCTFCIRLMIECEIKRVYYKRNGFDYTNEITRELIRESRLEFVLVT